MITFHVFVYLFTHKRYQILQEPEVLDPLEALNQLESQLAAEEYMTSCNGTSATTIKTSTSHMSSYNSRPFSGLHVLPERTVLTTPLPMIEAKTEPESIEDQQSDEQRDVKYSF